MDREKLKPLFKDGHYYSVPRGVSMWPLIKTPDCVVHIVPVDRELKRYDVALYHRESTDQYVLHRILNVEDDYYIFYGDNCWRKEIIPKDTVVGVATKYYRKGRWIYADDIRLKIYAHIWCDALPVRRAILRLRDEAKKVLNKIVKNPAMSWIFGVSGKLKLGVLLLVLLNSAISISAVAFALVLREAIDGAVSGNKMVFLKFVIILGLIMVGQIAARGVIRFLDEYVR